MEVDAIGLNRLPHLCLAAYASFTEVASACCVVPALLCGRCIWLPAAVTPVTCLGLWSDQGTRIEIFAHRTNVAGEDVPASKDLMLV